ncbi:type I-C CRISPR-associated endonuclease Cas1c [Yinghuangia sp. ASG 101]|uniref:type I-C CRISPR-associated endonuclease Cas1c n=1 Tax=Yinghuangia sp. ASG 101 TaxID=2896848 RepID=UPI001E3CD585|nr:type I-C CRISPR-associated endonuclease Cas1c [Yinghuangia sp. ASG 101]UGQ14970.1 type I-C CRISPR-associated endonuclease Cas1c [Yinghuangia sp. ASG 101]
MPTEILNTLYVQTQGASLHLDQDTVRIVLPDTPGRRTLPLRRIEGIVVYGHVNLSTELITRCADDRRPITWMTRGGRFSARLHGPAHGNVLLRHAQHVTHERLDQRTDIARAMVAGKIRNSRRVLLRSARDATGTEQTALRAAAEDLADALPQLPDAPGLNEVMGIEGNAARTYFAAMPALLRGADKDIPPFTGRNRRPPTDPANALFSFTYGLLRNLVHGATEQVGLDPYLGFLHGIRPGKPALVLDLMEEFRPLFADRLALTLLNRRTLRVKHFEALPGGAWQLTEDGRRIVFEAWQDFRRQEWEHPIAGRTVAAGLLPVMQARILARHLRGELPGYLPWTPA